MGKRIIQQARGKGSLTYRVRKKAYQYRLKFLRNLPDQGVILKLLNSAGHSAPIAKVKIAVEGKDKIKEHLVFYVPAAKGLVESEKINFNKNKEIGSVVKLKDMPLRSTVFCIESRPGDGGVFIKSAGGCGVVNKKQDGKVTVVMPSKKQKPFNEDCRAIVGVVAGHGRLEKPFVKAGRKYHLKKSKNKLWPRTSALKVNAIDHPFGSGRGKNPKSKIAKRNSSPGQKVGLLSPRRTGRKKR